MENLSLRQWLRQYTHEYHVRINRHPLLVGLTRPGYRIEKYRLLLAAYFHFYQTIDAMIDDFLSLEKNHALNFDYGPRRKLPWLIADLQFLDVDPQNTLWALRQPIVIPKLDDLGQLVGVLYTIEGATLGGHTIAPHLATNMALTANQGARFFNGYDTHTLEYWREFEYFAETVCHKSACWESAGQATCALFCLIEELLNDYHARFHP